MPALTAHYHEIALKGRNRRRFERALLRNLRRSLRPLGEVSARLLGGRILVEAPEGFDAAELAERARRVCGVAHVIAVKRVPRDLDAAAEAILPALERARPENFRVSTRRSDKSFPLTSLEIDREIGARLQARTGIPVRLKGSAYEAYVMVLPEEFLVGEDKRPGVGGLPVGTGGRVGVLLSGGIDSPVAAWRMIRRGCRCDLIHFHSHPLVDATSQEKAADLAEVLTRRQYATRLYLVPLARIQSEVRLKAPEALRVILYRRFMVRIAEEIAGRRRLKALVTGESLGQVASQTLQNLAVVDAVARYPILRPLIGFDKREIVAEAEEIGTYSISTRPDQDCCRLFTPAHPATGAKKMEVEAAEALFDTKALVHDALERMETKEFESA